MATDHMGGGMTRAQVEAYRKYEGSRDYDDPEFQQRDYEESIEHTVSQMLNINPIAVRIALIALGLLVAAAFAVPFLSLE